jgi:hypothetical protein
MSRQYEVVYTVAGSGAGVIREVVQAPSDYQARRIVEAKFAPATVTIYSTTILRERP